jgi:hypothetical protein
VSAAAEEILAAPFSCGASAIAVPTTLAVGFACAAKGCYLFQNYFDQSVVYEATNDAEQGSEQRSNIADEHYNLNNIADKKINDLAKEIQEWLGEDARFIKNDSGDTILLSKNGNRRVRFDINRPYPHESPHGHIEEFVNGKWQKSGPIYPHDIPHQ